VTQESQHDRDLRMLFNFWEMACESARESFLETIVSTSPAAMSREERLRQTLKQVRLVVYTLSDTWGAAELVRRMQSSEARLIRERLPQALTWLTALSAELTKIASEQPVATTGNEAGSFERRRRLN
jgi:hypothetical protein